MKSLEELVLEPTDLIYPFSGMIDDFEAIIKEKMRAVLDAL